MKKNSVILLIIMGVLGSCGLFLWQGKTKRSVPTASIQPLNGTPAPFDAALNAVLVKKIALLTTLAHDPVMITAVTTAYAKNKALSQSDIAALDKQWKDSKGVDAFIKPFLTNDTADVLLAFAEKNSGFTEMFVTDAVGLNVGQTNKTSDYYQADEQWWVDAYAGGAGYAYWGQIEYDDSAKTEAIPLYVPVLGSNGEALGVLKAILDVNAIKREL